MPNLTITQEKLVTDFAQALKDISATLFCSLTPREDFHQVFMTHIAPYQKILLDTLNADLKEADETRLAMKFEYWLQVFTKCKNNKDYLTAGILASVLINHPQRTKIFAKISEEARKAFYGELKPFAIESGIKEQAFIPFLTDRHYTSAEVKVMQDLQDAVEQGRTDNPLYFLQQYVIPEFLQSKEWSTLSIEYQQGMQRVFVALSDAAKPIKFLNKTLSDFEAQLLMEFKDRDRLETKLGLHTYKEMLLYIFIENYIENGKQGLLAEVLQKEAKLEFKTSRPHEIFAIAEKEHRGLINYVVEKFLTNDFYQGSEDRYLHCVKILKKAGRGDLCRMLTGEEKPTNSQIKASWPLLKEKDFEVIKTKIGHVRQGRWR